nr:hypothetical protein [Tanacetum cinerariifolium]
MAAEDSDDALVCCVENTIEDHIIDSGASFNAANCKEELERFKLRSGKVRLVDDKTLDIAGIEGVVLKTSFGTSWNLKDVRYILGLKRRLISVGRLDEEGYHHQRFGDMRRIGMNMLASKGNVLDVHKVDIYFCKPGGLRNQKKHSFIMSEKIRKLQRVKDVCEEAMKCTFICNGSDEMHTTFEIQRVIRSLEDSGRSNEKDSKDGASSKEGGSKTPQEVIEFGDSYKAPPKETAKDKGLAGEVSASTKKKGRTVAITVEDMQKRKNDLNEAILKTFGGNETTKKTRISSNSNMITKESRQREERERESYKKDPKVEEPAPKAMIAIDDLDRLLGSQKLDKDNKGVGFNEYCAIPPPPVQVYSPPKKDLSWMGLPEFVDDIVTDYTRPTPSIDVSKSISNELEERWKSNNPSIFEQGGSSSNVVSKPMIKFVKDSGCPNAIKASGCSRRGKITGKGSIKTGKLEFENVYFVEELKYNLLSVSQICDNKNSVLFTDTEYHVLGKDFKLVDDKHDETSRILRNFISEIENLKDLKVKIIRSDNGGEFRNKEMDELCSWKARTMITDAKLPVTFWAEVVNTACYVQNRVLVIKPHNKTPYELFNERSPAIGLLRPFRCHVMLLNTLDHLGKFDAKRDEGYFVRYSLSSKAFRVFNKRTRKIEENLHVDFLENRSIEKGTDPDWLFGIDTLTNSMNYIPVVVAGTSSTNISGTKEDAHQDVKEKKSPLRFIDLPNWFHKAQMATSNKAAKKDDAILDNNAPQKEQKDVNRDKEVPERSGNSNPMLVQKSLLMTHLSLLQAQQWKLKFPLGGSSYPEPLGNAMSFENMLEDFFGDTSDAISLNNVEADLSNMETAIQVSPTPTLRIHKDHPKRVRPIGTKWVLKNKKDERGIVIRNKARLVAQGHTQEEGIDYEEVFAPIARIKVEKAMYGLRQALRACYGTLSKYLLDNGFQRGTMDQTLFIKKHKGEFLLVQVYVDDVIFGSSNPMLCREFEALMHDKFQMSDMGELNFFLGLQVLQKKDASSSHKTNEPAFPTGDARYMEAFPTVTSLDGGQDRESIAKIFAMPHDASPRVTSLGGESRFLRIMRRGEKALLRRMLQTSGVDKGDDLLVGDTMKDSDKSVDKGSDSTDDMANVLGTLGATNILANRGLRSVFTTASTDLSPAVATASGSFPTTTAKASGTEPTQEQQSKEPKELSEEELKKIMEIVPAKYWKIIRVGNHTYIYQIFDEKFNREDLDRLWSLVKETCSTTEVTDEKEKELWVELKRLYEPDSRDPL